MKIFNSRNSLFAKVNGLQPLYSTLNLLEMILFMYFLGNKTILT